MYLISTIDTCNVVKAETFKFPIEPVPPSYWLTVDFSQYARPKKKVSLGEFEATAYCSCEKCCGKWAKNRPDGIVYGASGKELTAGYSIAVDPSVIPYGTIVIIDGKEYEAMDCGGAIKDNKIDFYFATHKEAKEFGVQTIELFVEE